MRGSYGNSTGEAMVSWKKLGEVLASKGGSYGIFLKIGGSYGIFGREVMVSFKKGSYGVLRGEFHKNTHPPQYLLCLLIFCRGLPDISKTSEGDARCN